MATRKDTKVVKEIISRYGDTLDLKASPYLILEIIRQYGGTLGAPVADCAPPGGPPLGQYDPLELVGELKARASDITRLTTLFEKTVKSSAKAAPKRKAKK